MQLTKSFLAAASLLTLTFAVPAPAIERSVAQAEAKIATRNMTATEGGAFVTVYAGVGCTGDNWTFTVNGGSDFCQSASGRSMYFGGE